MSAITKIFFVLTFVFGTAIGYTTKVDRLTVERKYKILYLASYTTKVDRLTVEGNYKIPQCSVNVTCYVETSDPYIYIKWVCYGGPDVKDITKIPGFTVGLLKYTGNGRVEQTISINKCYDKLELKCSAGSSSKKVTLCSGICLSVKAIIGIVVGVIVVASAIGGYIFRRRRRMARAATKLNSNGNTTLNPSLKSYPTQLAPIYQISTAAYPQQGIPSNPQQPGPVYPQEQPPPYFPSPSQPTTAYSEKALQLYPNHNGQLQPLHQKPPPYSGQAPSAPV